MLLAAIEDEELQRSMSPSLCVAGERPVAQEFLRNAKGELNKLVHVLQAYALVAPQVSLSRLRSR